MGNVREEGKGREVLHYTKTDIVRGVKQGVEVKELGLRAQSLSSNPHKGGKNFLPRRYQDGYLPHILLNYQYHK